MVDLACAPPTDVDRLVALLDLAAVPMFAVGLDLVVAGVNRPFRERFGEEATAVVGHPVRSLLDHADQGLHDTLALLVGDDSVERETVVRHVVDPSGRHFAVRVAIERVRCDGRTVGFAVTVLANDALAPLRSPAEVLERRWLTLLDDLPLAVLLTTRGVPRFINAAALDLLGCDTLLEAATRVRAMAHLHPKDHARLAQRLADIAAGVSPLPPMTWTLVRPDGSERVVLSRTLHVPFDDGEADLLTLVDVTEQRQALDALAESEARFRELADGSPDVVVRLRLDPIGFDYISPSVAALTGTPPDAYAARPGLFRDQIHPDDVDRVVALVYGGGDEVHAEFRLAHSDGGYHVIDARMHRHIVDGRLVSVDATLRDVTVAAHLREHLRDLARRDPLTGLLNRRALIDELHERMARAQPTSVLFIDLDDFKSVNDTLGHEAGDEVLTAIAGRLSGGVRAGALISRFAGDEFVIALDPEGADEVAARLRRAAARPIALRSGARTTVHMSVGIAELDPAAHEPVRDLLRRADAAMYRCKEGRGPAGASRRV